MASRFPLLNHALKCMIESKSLVCKPLPSHGAGVVVLGPAFNCGLLVAVAK